MAISFIAASADFAQPSGFDAGIRCASLLQMMFTSIADDITHRAAALRPFFYASAFLMLSYRRAKGSATGIVGLAPIDFEFRACSR